MKLCLIYIYYIYFSFPKNEELRLRWTHAVNRSNPDRTLWMPGQNAVLCSKYFKETDFNRTGQTIRLRLDTIPSIFDVPLHLKVINHISSLCHQQSV